MQLIIKETGLLNKNTIRINEAKRNKSKFFSLVQKLQCLHLAKNYMAGVQNVCIKDFYNSGYFSTQTSFDIKAPF